MLPFYAASGSVGVAVIVNLMEHQNHVLTLRSCSPLNDSCSL